MCIITLKDITVLKQFDSDGKKNLFLFCKNKVYPAVKSRFWDTTVYAGAVNLYT